MRLIEIRPEDRTLTRDKWKTLDRAYRILGRKYQPLINEYATNLLIYGAAKIVEVDGEFRVVTPKEGLESAPMA